MTVIQCPKCGNDTRTTTLVTAMGEVMVAGTIATDPQPIIAQVCSACGYIELYAPQPIHPVETVAREEAHVPEMSEMPVPAA